MIRYENAFAANWQQYLHCIRWHCRRLRMEQSKLGGLQDQIDRLDKTLESAGPQSAVNPR